MRKITALITIVSATLLSTLYVPYQVQVTECQ
jgi:hypothetical protein